jgi:hypothetical protein
MQFQPKKKILGLGISTQDILLPSAQVGFDKLL